jgi:mannan endo-1,4-beta-mannosidase
MAPARPFRRRTLLAAGAAAVGGAVWPACAEIGEPAMRLPPGKEWIPHRPPTPVLPGGLGVAEARFVKNGRPFFIHGFNHWAAATLARADVAGGWDGVRRDLDDLQAAGTNVVRVFCGGEGRNDDFPSLTPTLQPALGEFDPVGVAALHRLVDELERRDLHAILVLTNFHPWTGGLRQYMDWTGQGGLPVRGRTRWLTNYMQWATTARFYEREPATAAFAAFVRFLVPQFRDRRAVIWELCNEARGFDSQTLPFQTWIARTAALVKSLAPAQLVTTGSQGDLGMGQGNSVVRDHESPHIDFVTFHAWPSFWELDGYRAPGPRDVEGAEGQIRRHVELATNLGKPIVLEAFAYQRDGISLEPGTPTTHRDRYFDAIYGLCHTLAPDTTMAGLLPWAWGGDRRPPRPPERWRVGDPFTGDALDEPQGRASVYRGDSTLGIIKTWAARPITGIRRTRT